MLKNRFLYLWILALAFIATVLAFFGFNVFFASSEAKWEEVALQGVYSIGDKIEVPSSKLTIDGTEYDTTCVVIFPDGSAKKTDKIIVKESGEYQLVYKTVVDGKAFEKKISFLVNNVLYSVSSDSSSASYGNNAYLPNDVEGINISLVAGDKFSFNKVIDLTNMTKEDYICKFYLTPKISGEPDVATVKLTIRDIYDADNYVTMYYKLKILSEVNYGTIYRMVGANNQAPVGLFYEKDGKGDNTDESTFIQYGNYWFSANRNPIYGAGVNISSDGIARNRDFIDNYEYFAMDYDSKQVFARPYWYPFEPYNLIADLDDDRMMGNTLWDGFTTGECLLTIEGVSYIKSSLNIFVTEIAGYDLSNDHFNFKDDIAPTLNIDFGEYTKDNLPNAVIDKPYRLFEATSYDNLEGSIQPTVIVYFNYYSDMRTLVNIKEGAFTPKREGVYTVIYTAKDSVGNVTTESYDLVAVSENNFRITAAEPTESAVAASPVKLGKFTVSNNSGNYKVKIEATLKTDKSVCYEVDTRSLSFVPLYTGEYEIKYIATDYIETVDCKFNLTVEAPTNPKLVEDANLPRYLIKGAEYEFDSINAYSYTSAGRSEIPTKLSVVEDNSGVEQKLSDNKYTVNASSVVKLIYTATDGSGHVGTKFYEIPVIDVNYGESVTNISEYFQGKGFISESSANGVVYKNEDSVGDVKLSYIRRALLDGFKIDFLILDDYADYEKITLILTDTQNSNNALRISVIKQTSEFLFYVHNSDRSYSIAYYENMETITVSYNKRSNVITFNGSLNVSASDCGFNGFEGYFVDFDIVFEKAHGKVGIELNKLYMQPLAKSLTDNISPQMFEYNRSATMCTLNEDVEIVAPYFFDVLDPNITATITVLNPNGDYVTAADGTILSNANATKDYRISLNQYGIWSVEYLVEDNRGNSINPSYVFRVVDDVPPTIEISNATLSYKVGEALKLPSPVIDDNHSSVDKITKAVLVCDSKGIVQFVDETSDFTLNEVGKYTVYYYLIDEAGNATVKSYTITVRGE